MSGWLIYFGTILGLFYLVVSLAAPRKWLFSLLFLLYGVVMVFIADEVRADYGSNDPLYSILNASAGLALVVVILLPLVEGVLKLGLMPFVSHGEARSKIADAAYWFAVGCTIPFVMVCWRVFARYAGTVVIPTLLATAIVALALFVGLRRRGMMRGALLVVPGYALAVTVMLTVSLFYGAKVSSAAATLAQDAPYCIRSYPTFVTSTLDMTPLTLISRGISEYHAELVVEAKPTPLIYNWSWQSLSFAPTPLDKQHVEKCQVFEQ